MINLHERMLPASAGVEPATSWSQVGQIVHGQVHSAGNMTLLPWLSVPFQTGVNLLGKNLQLSVSGERMCTILVKDLED